MAKTVYVLNGPNLNLLGTREPKTYGHATLKDVEKLCREAAERHKLAVEFRQSNHEGEIVDLIHEAAAKKAAGIIINAGAYTHTSVAIPRSPSATRSRRSRCRWSRSTSATSSRARIFATIPTSPRSPRRAWAASASAATRSRSTGWPR